MRWMWTSLVTSLVLTAWQSEAALHHGLTADEHWYLFERELHEGVPDYEIITPHRLNSDGSFRTHNLRTRRSSDDDHETEAKYHVEGLGQKVVLDLKRNEDLISPHLRVTERDHKKASIRTDLHNPERCYYQSSHTTGQSAVSTCDGLNGVIVNNGAAYGIKPLPAHLAKKHASEAGQEGKQAHVLYKLLLKAIDLLEAKDTLAPKDHEEGFLVDSRASADDAKKPTATVELAVFWDNYERARAVGDTTGASLIKYALVQLNAVDMLYHFSSLERMIDIVLVRLELLKNRPPELDYKDSDRAGVKVNKFIPYQAALNPKDDSDPTHWDHAHLWTETSGGLASACTICSSTRNVGVTTNKRITGVMPHELAHNLCVGHKPTGVMTHTLGMSKETFWITPWTAGDVKEFEKCFTGRCGRCLFDPAVPKPGMDLKNVGLPGLVINVDEQCALVYNAKYKACRNKPMESVCQHLFCGHGSTCQGLVMPALPGSVCGKNKICMGNKCVDTKLTEGLKVEWSDWKPTTSCSKLQYENETDMSCVPHSHQTRSSERTCSSHIASICEGHSKQIELCTTHTCPGVKAKNINEMANQRCAKHYPGSRFHTLNADGCKFHCHKGSYQKWPWAPDGMYCGDSKEATRGSNAYCLQGKCRVFGCDNKFPAVKKFDKCRVCGGDGSSCSGPYNYDGGWRVISDGQCSDSNCIKANNGQMGLAMKTVERVCDNPRPLFHLGGKPCEGTTVLLKFCDLPPCDKSKIRSRTDVQKSLCKANGWTNFQTQDGYNGHYACANYCYYKGWTKPMPEGTPCAPGSYCQKGEKCVKKGCDSSIPSVKKPDKCGVCGGDGSSCDPSITYSWKTRLTPCTKSCGTGTTLKVLSCVSSTGVVASESKCDPAARPTDLELKCNTNLCPARYSAKPWSVCSKTCGGGAMKTRRVVCERESAPGVYIEQKESECAGQTKPSTTSLCNFKACIETSWSKWGACSTTCGPGQRKRTNGKKTETQDCNLKDCPPTPVDGGLGLWTQWGSCSVTCGQGVMRRTRKCDNPPASDGGAGCSDSLEEERICTKDKCNQQVDGQWGKWNPWSSCSVTCGAGVKSRSRLCDNPSPKHGGASCPGDGYERANCKDADCKPVGGPCSQIQCENGGKCEVVKNKAKCNCAESFFGPKCKSSYTKGRCYFNGRPRVFSNHKSFRSGIDWYDLTKTIDSCATYASDLGWKEFAIEFYGECWYNRTLPVDTHGPSEQAKACQMGVGGANEFQTFTINQN